MPAKHSIVALLLLVGLGAGKPEAKPKPSADQPKGETLVLPTMVVTGHQIPTGWLEVTWECANPLPFCPIKHAWISKVGWGTPAAEVGIKKNDRLLAFDGREIGKMSGEQLHDDLLRGHNVGDRLELVIQTPGHEPRTVVIHFE